jgi:divalent metal cation (Fe/Co/Zn/Cd) transporter
MAIELKTLSPDAEKVNTLKKRALLLYYITVGYNVFEGGIAIFAGWLAGSIALVGFGLDSFMESLSGGVMIWRFTHRAQLSAEEELRREKKAVKLIGYTFFVLGAYVLYESAEKLITAEPPGPSLLGIIIAVISLIAMPVLFYAKHRTGKSMQSRSLVADSKQTLACMFLSLALLIGLGLNYLWGLWWADPAVGLVVVGFLFREGRNAIKEEKLCTCCSCPTD